LNEELAAKLASAAARKARREERRIANAALKGETVAGTAPPSLEQPSERPRYAKRGKSQIRPVKRKKRKIKRGSLSRQIVRLLGLLDKKKNGPLCRLGELCPQFPKIGHHYGELGYHIIAQSRGGEARFHPSNVVWACGPANCGEHYHKGLYREKHVALWGEEFVKGLEAMAKVAADYSMSQLLELRENLKAQVEGA
jgi:hypothetical protein